MPNTSWVVVPSAARTTNGTSSAFSAASNALDLQVTVSAVSGTTPSLALSVQWSDDGTNFGPVDGTGDAFAAITATGTVAKSLTVKGLYYQLVWAITGTTPSFTFFVEGAS